MAIGKKYGGRDFKPGNPGGPGRGTVPKELKEARKLTAAMVQETMNKLMELPMPDLLSKTKSGDLTALEAMIVGQILAASKGKTSPVAFLLDRSIGPLKHQFKVTVDGGLSADISKLTEEQKVERLAKLTQRIKPSE